MKINKETIKKFFKENPKRSICLILVLAGIYFFIVCIPYYRDILSVNNTIILVLIPLLFFAVAFGLLIRNTNFDISSYIATSAILIAIITFFIQNTINYQDNQAKNIREENSKKIAFDSINTYNCILANKFITELESLKQSNDKNILVNLNKDYNYAWIYQHFGQKWLDTTFELVSSIDAINSLISTVQKLNLQGIDINLVPSIIVSKEQYNTEIVKRLKDLKTHINKVSKCE